MQLLLPPADLVLLRQRTADRSAGGMGFMGRGSPGLLVEEGCGLLGGEGSGLKCGEFELIAVYLVVFFEHAVVDGGLDVDDVAFAIGEG